MNKTCGRKNHGFTLAELLVVVAIIAVLVAVSVPIFTSQLDKAKVATNQANIRSAKSAAAADYLSTGCSTAAAYVYDVTSGTLLDVTDLASGNTYFTIDASDPYRLLSKSGGPTLSQKESDNLFGSSIEHYQYKYLVNDIWQFVIVWISPTETTTLPHYDSSSETIVETFG